MRVAYVDATPELKERYREQSGSNACDFLRFEENEYSVIALTDEGPVRLVVARRRRLSEPLQQISEAFIDIVEVLPDYRKQGIATTLVTKVIEWAVVSQAAQVRAWSEEIRCEVLFLWNKMGFTFSRVDFQRGDEKRYGFYVAKRL